VVENTRRDEGLVGEIGRERLCVSSAAGGAESNYLASLWRTIVARRLAGARPKNM
jgi:hypothetical protein